MAAETAVASIASLNQAELTLAGPLLHIDNHDSSCALNLRAEQSLELRRELARFDGFAQDSADAPLLLGGMTLLRNSARPVCAELIAKNAKDCQVRGVSLELAGERLLLKKGSERAFLALSAEQAAQVRADLLAGTPA